MSCKQPKFSFQYHNTAQIFKSQIPLVPDHFRQLCGGRFSVCGADPAVYDRQEQRHPEVLGRPLRLRENNRRKVRQLNRFFENEFK